MYIFMVCGKRYIWVIFMYLTEDMNSNIKELKNIFKGCDDVIFKIFKAGIKPCCLIYTDNIIHNETVRESILTDLMHKFEGESAADIALKGITVGDVKEEGDINNVVSAVLWGDSVVLTEGYKKAFVISTKGWPTRGIPKVETEMTVYGPKDAFTEAGSINTVLIRRRIRDASLKVRRMRCGRRSKTDIAVMYLEDVARGDIVNDVINKIKALDIDMIIDSGYLQQMIEKNSISPFPQMQLTERPDKAAASIYEGRIVIVVDNSPFVIIVPSTFNVFFQAAEDYYERWEIVSFLRLLRYIAAGVATLLPGLYIALTLFHANMIPTSLALKAAAGRGNVPFPSLVELLIMEFAFELLREAGVRLPSPVSSAIGIVGGIIIGQSAVEAGIVGPMVVIVVALSGICSFVVPNTAMVSALRLVKYIVIILSAFFGMLGFWIGVIFVIGHLCSLESFNFPYLYPFCGVDDDDYTDYKDSVIRRPIYKMIKRPVFAKNSQKIRMRKGGDI